MKIIIGTYTCVVCESESVYTFNKIVGVKFLDLDRRLDLVQQ